MEAYDAGLLHENDALPVYKEEDFLNIGVLHLNKAQCQLKLKLLDEALQSVEFALQNLEKSGAENFAKYREKAVYRRSLARWALASQSITKKDKLEHLNLAASDLVEILHYNNKNNSAKSLLNKVRIAAKVLNAEKLLDVQRMNDEGDIIEALRDCLRTEEYSKVGLTTLFGK